MKNNFVFYTNIKKFPKPLLFLFILLILILIPIILGLAIVGGLLTLSYRIIKNFLPAKQNNKIETRDGVTTIDITERNRFIN